MGQEPERKPEPSPKRDGSKDGDAGKPRRPFKLTENDRRFLRSLRIKPEE